MKDSSKPARKAARNKTDRSSPKPPSETIGTLERLGQWPRDLLGLLRQYGGTALRISDSVILNAEQLTRLSTSDQSLLREAGELISDFRKVAGLTYDDLANALDLEDQSLLQAIESGTATLSFEFILKLASLLARHDPIPFVLQLIRAYQPGIWEWLERWGIGLWPTHYERERRFLNIYRSNDQARQLDDEQFRAVCEITRRTFEVHVAWLLQQRELAVQATE
jgi:transcriptional regulator with XRE-family HTH domain